MGRNTTTPNPSSLDRFSVGEIVDISGVPSYYDAGTSKWLQSGTFVDGTNLSAATKSTLAASATNASAATVALGTANDAAIAQQYPALREQWDVSRISSISTTVIPRSMNNGSGPVNIMVLNSSGVTNVTVVGTSHLGAQGYGSAFALTSNNSKFFIYYFTSTTALACKSSTDGITWTTETLSSLPTIGGVDSNSSFWDFNYYNTAGPQQGWKYNVVGAATYGVNLVRWCGARFLLLTRNSAGNCIASLSSNGTTFGGDNTTAVLGTTTMGFLNDVNFYRNGNTCFLAIGTLRRYSTDGGVTWGAISSGIGTDANNHFNIPNTTDPAKRIINSGDGSATAYYTADSGATWSASRSLPQPSRWSLAYKGSTVVSGYTGGCWRSVDDGVTWTPIVFPAGTNSSSGQILADAYRFYFVPNGQSQILTSTDAITWTIASTPGAVNASGGTSSFSASSSLIYITLSDRSRGIFSLDGGVTWAFASTTTGSYGNNLTSYSSSATLDGPSGGYLTQYYGTLDNAGYNVFLSVAALSAGGGFYRTGSTAITPVRTGALSYVRVG